MRRIIGHLHNNNTDVLKKVGFVADFLEESDYTEVIDKVFYLYLVECRDLGIPFSKKALLSYFKVDGKKLILDYSLRLSDIESSVHDDVGALNVTHKKILELLDETYEMYAEINEGVIFQEVMREEFAELKQIQVTEVLGEVVSKVAQESLDHDELESFTDQVAILNERFNPEHIKQVFSYNDSGRRESSGVLLAKTGLPALDEAMGGGIYSDLLYTLTGQPKSGKSRFVLARVVYNMLLAGYDVRFDSLEMTRKQVEDILIAHHIIHMYNQRVKIPDSSMRQRDGLSEEQDSYVNTARIDLFENPKNGKLEVFDSTRPSLTAETMRQKVTSYVRANPKCGLWVVDYVGLVESVPLRKYDRTLDVPQIISKSYIAMKRINAACPNTAIVALNQFNKEGVDNALQGKRITTSDIQGGQAVERDTLCNIVMTYTEEQFNAGLRSIEINAQRFGQPMPKTPMKVDLATSVFNQYAE